LGQVLAIKPLLKLEDGVVAEAGRQRTRSKALAAIAESAKTHAPFARLAIMDAMCDDADQLLRHFDGVDCATTLVRADIGPVVGTHGGPGIIGVAWIGAGD
jgi:fatty acid-binding protein DegV